MHTSFGRRLAVAALLLAGFYAFALLVGGGALAIAVLQWITPLPQNIWVTLACAVTGFSILQALVPRRVPFVPPGPVLEAQRHPRLHALIDDVAREVGQQPPAEVYLAPDVNASVSQRGGLLGLGGRRVLVIGLPLLGALTAPQLRAVIAHEFGHYHSGDTRLGPWFYRAYDAIERTIVALHQAESIWERPFGWYGDFFLRRTAAVKRRQEYVADEISARVAGRAAAIGSLEAVAAAALVYDVYWANEALPVLEAGRRPPLLEGFARCRLAESVANAVDESMQLEFKEVAADPYDTHPSLRERIAALERLPAGDAGSSPDAQAPALSLVDDPDELELELLAALAGDDEAARLQPIGWDSVAEEVVIPSWQEFVRAHEAALRDLTVDDVAGLMPRLTRFGYELFPPGERPVETELHRALGISVLGTAIAVALHEAGWRISIPVGEAVIAELGGERIEPFTAVERLAAGDMDAQAWAELSGRAGIGSLSLAPSSRSPADDLRTPAEAPEPVRGRSRP